MLLVNVKKWILASVLSVSLVSTVSHAATNNSNHSDPAQSVDLQASLRRQIEKIYSGARIEFISGVRWAGGESPTEFHDVRLSSEIQKGVMGFVVDNQTTGNVSFAAWILAPVAKRRIQPGERLSKDLFESREINVTQGLDREYRGVILPMNSEFSKLEARQTVMEGNYPVLTGVQKIPDIRRGDMVSIHIHTGGVDLNTQAVAQEAGYQSENIRVLTVKTKKEFLGRLQSDGSVEVTL